MRACSGVLWSQAAESVWLFQMSYDKVAISASFPSLCSTARRYCRLGTSSDVCGVFVQSNVLMTARTLEYLHLRSDVSSFPISSSQFLYTSICFPCCLQKLVLASAGFPYPARALRRQYDIRTLSLPARVQSLFPSVDATSHSIWDVFSL